MWTLSPEEACTTAGVDELGAANVYAVEVVTPPPAKGIVVVEYAVERSGAAGPGAVSCAVVSAALDEDAAEVPPCEVNVVFA
jgi:hypothetical protein